MIEEETQGAVRVIRLAQPEAMNAFTLDGVMALRAALARAGAEARAVLLTGTGPAFSVGVDLRDPAMAPPPDAREDMAGAELTGLIRDITTCPVPVVTAINGICAGGGVGLALSGDMAVAGASARLLAGSVPVLGQTPDMGTTWQLTRRLGRARALGLTLTGQEIPAASALDWGLIWDVVPDAELETAALALAAMLAEGPTGAQTALRGLIDAAAGNDLPAQLEAERQVRARRATSPEVREAMESLRENRPPDFTRTHRAPGDPEA